MMNGRPAESFYQRVALIARREALHLTQEQVAERCNVDTTTYQRWENAERKPSAKNRVRLAAALEVSLDELELLLEISLVTGDVVEDAISTVAAEASGVDVIDTALMPSSIGRREIEQIAMVTRQLTQLEYQFGGGGLVRQTGVIQLRWASSLLDVKSPAALRTELFGAVARLSMRVGATAFDLSDHDAARKAFMFACKTAEEVDDWHLRAKVYSYLGRQAAWLGLPDQGLTFADYGLVRADRLTATERAMLHVTRARCLGRMGRIEETRAAIGDADDAFARHRPAEDPPWMAYYDAAQHQGDTAHALFHIAVDGQRDLFAEATRRFRVAVNGHSAAYARSRAFSRAKLASLLMVAGDPAEAHDIGRGALTDFSTVSSQRRIRPIIADRRRPRVIYKTVAQQSAFGRYVCGASAR